MRFCMVLLHNTHISLYIPLGLNGYEIHHVINGKNGLLDVSEVIWWQDQYCFNDVVNIFTRESVDEEEISTSIHNYSHPVSQNDTGDN